MADMTKKTEISIKFCYFENAVEWKNLTDTKKKVLNSGWKNYFSCKKEFEKGEGNQRNMFKK